MLSEVRTTLAADLGSISDANVYDNYPDRLTVPAVIVLPARAGSYVAAGQFEGTFEVNVDVMVLVREGSYATALPEIEALVEQVLINAADWALRGVDPIGVFNADGATHPGTLIHLAKQSKLY